MVKGRDQTAVQMTGGSMGETERENLYGGLQLFEDAARPFSKEKRLMAIAEPMLRWFERNARILPWRSDPSPYHVWVSEIMLQQTRVEAVKPYYARFMETLPGIRELSEAPEDLLLKLWEGLGYYSRVRNMQKAAVQVMEEYGGELPAEAKELQKLKGIGSYTAGAISSIAYGRPAPAVDGNVLRVISRITASRDDIGEASTKKQMEADLTPVLEQSGNPGNLNQALMELGATVCVPNGAPDCDRCPVSGLCLARRDGLTGEIPVKARKKARRIEDKTVYVVECGDFVLLQKRPDKGLLAGLYEFPNAEGKESREEAASRWEKILNVPVQVQELGEARHIFSHIEWRMNGYSIRPVPVGEEPPALDGEGPFWVSRSQMKEHYSLPSALKAYTGQIGRHREK